MIIAIDFDGTCCTHEYPEIGKDIGAIPVLKALSVAGHRLVLWTMRSGDRKQQALNYLHNRGVDIVADDDLFPSQKEWTQSSKLYAQLYIDDAALGVPLIYPAASRPFIDWEQTQRLLRRLGYFGDTK